MATPKKGMIPKPKLPTKRTTVKAVTARTHETRNTQNYHGSRTATEKRVGESVHKVPTINMKKIAEAASQVQFRAGERASAQKVTGRSTATSVKRKAPGLTAPPKKGATVGDAMRAVNRGIQGALKSSPGLRSKGIENVMKLPPKKKVK